MRISIHVFFLSVLITLGLAELDVGDCDEVHFGGDEDGVECVHSDDVSDSIEGENGGDRRRLSFGKDLDGLIDRESSADLIRRRLASDIPTTINYSNIKKYMKKLMCDYDTNSNLRDHAIEELRSHFDNNKKWDWFVLVTNELDKKNIDENVLYGYPYYSNWSTSGFNSAKLKHVWVRRHCLKNMVVMLSKRSHPGCTSLHNSMYDKIYEVTDTSKKSLKKAHTLGNHLVDLIGPTDYVFMIVRYGNGARGAWSCLSHKCFWINKGLKQTGEHKSSYLGMYTC